MSEKITSVDHTIGALGKLTGVNIETIRYYERIGLLPGAARTSGNYRVYGDTHVRRLTFIRKARDLGFPSRRCGRCWLCRTSRTALAARSTRWSSSRCARSSARSRTWNACGRNSTGSPISAGAGRI